MAESSIAENQTPDLKDNHAIDNLFVAATTAAAAGPQVKSMNNMRDNGIMLAISVAALLLKLHSVESSASIMAHHHGWFDPPGLTHAWTTAAKMAGRIPMELGLTHHKHGLTHAWTTATQMASRLPMELWEDYSRVLSESPIETKAATSATVYTIGDIIAQRTEGVSMDELDTGRTLRSLLAGAIGHGPLSHYWYDMSEGLFNDVLHWTAWWSLFPKVILDQATWAPFWNNAYILLLGLMKRDSMTVMWKDVRRTTVPLIVSGLKLWPLAHCVTYGLVPVENRLLWVDVVEILWVTILASQAAASTGETEMTCEES